MSRFGNGLCKVNIIDTVTIFNAGESDYYEYIRGSLEVKEAKMQALLVGRASKGIWKASDTI